MLVGYDPAKNDRNIAERGLSLECAAEFDFSTALVIEDVRKTYPERRFQALGFVGERLHMLVYALVGSGIRVISFRKANKREVARYDRTQKAQPRDD